MALENWLVAVAGVCVLSACSGSDPNQPANGVPVMPSSSGGAAATVPGGGGASGTTTSLGGAAPGVGGDTAVPGGGGASGGGPVGAGGSAPIIDPGGAFDYSNQTVTLAADLVIPAGQTVRVGPGVTFNAAAKVSIQVQGTLIVAGSTESPSHFLGTAALPNSWGGIVIASGGSLQMQHAEVGGATYGVHALPGSTYDLDHMTFNTSFKPAVLESNGKIDHTRFLATAPPTISLAADVTIDDPNGAMTIMNASPTVTNSEFDGAMAFTDMVRIGGNSTPIFDHDLLKGAHCGFHTFGGTNSSAQITNSIIQGMSYGVMAFTTKPVFKSCVFEGNTNDAGFCYGATTANAPVFDGNYYASGASTFDASCVGVGTAPTNTVAATIAGAGPVGL